MKIGIISDTHGYLDEVVFHYFAKCDEVWHAGDIGSVEIGKRLAAFKPLKAVYGNIDDHDVRMHYPLDQHFTCAGLHIWLTHIAGKPNAYSPRVQKIFQEKKPDVLVCGHTHILRVIRDAKYHPLLYLNPGAAGKYGIHTIRTLLRFEIKNQKLCNMEVIELGSNTNHAIY
ncbi:MAG: metallophosphoesterase family protein [Bacteroidota bacterium]